MFTHFKKNEGEVEKVAVHKEGNKVIQETFGKLFPDYDKSRVYASDMKKMLKWYGILKKLNLLDTLEESSEDGEDGKKGAAAPKAKKKLAAKNTAVSKSPAKKPPSTIMKSKKG